ncbi:hypothetical protein ACFV9E_04645 [Streptomyces sp. NPDC059835]|uniref:hypothetical protein n=1 Tax=Streptomyces sp. NPDC059835 TaxID=3346967 RepID=UPI0036474059
MPALLCGADRPVFVRLVFVRLSTAVVPILGVASHVGSDDLAQSPVHRHRLDEAPLLAYLRARQATALYGQPAVIEELFEQCSAAGHYEVRFR